MQRSAVQLALSRQSAGRRADHIVHLQGGVQCYCSVAYNCFALLRVSDLVKGEAVLIVARQLCFGRRNLAPVAGV